MKNLVLSLALILALAGAACKKEQPPAPTEPVASEQTTEQTAAQPTEPAAPPQQPAATANESPKSYRYVLEASGPGQPKMRFEYLVVPPKMNIKMMSDENGRLVTSVNMISDGVSYWILQEDAKIAMKMPAEAKPEIPETFVFAPDWSEFVKTKEQGYGVEDQGKVDLNGQTVTKYLIKNPLGKEQMTVFVSGDNLVRRIEVPPQEGQSAPFVMDVIELEMNPSTTDADFQPPAGFTVQEIPGMGGMGGMPGAVPPKP